MALSDVEGSSKEENIVLHDHCGWDKKEQAYTELGKIMIGHESVRRGDGKKTHANHHLCLIAGIAWVTWAVIQSPSLKVVKKR